MAKKRVLVVGLGNMGMGHALAYARIDGFEVVGVCERNIAERALPEALAAPERFAGYAEALAALKPEVVSIYTLADTHADYAIKRWRRGPTSSSRSRWPRPSRTPSAWSPRRPETGRKLVVGYILRHHPSWMKFIELARTLGRPLSSA